MAEAGKKALRGWRRLEKVSRLVTARIEDALKDAGLPPLAWLRAFEELERRGEEGLRPFELQKALGVEQPAVSRLLDRMTAAGMLGRRECAEDRRGWTVSATPLGRETRMRMSQVYGQALAAHYLAHLTDKQARALDEILGEFLDAVRG